MAILSTTDLGQSFGAFDLFAGINVSIESDARIGLVGPNGIGKTTLLLFLCGLDQPTTGRVHRVQGLRLGYLRQEAMQAFEEKENTVYEEMLTVFAGVHALEDKMRELEDQMASDYSDEVLEEYGIVQTEYERIGGYDYEVRIKQTLDGLGFKEQHYHMPLYQLSGGQKTRALLARLLLERPDLLILDEPTNHLDVGAVEWLEKTLRNWHGALLIVSHDRYFLDAVVNITWEMSRTGIEVYRGNYSAYVLQRTERWERAEKVYESERERLLSEMDYIKRNIVRASTNGMAVGRLRRLSRDLVAIQEVGIMAYKQSRKWSELGIGGVRMFTVQEAEDAIKAIKSPNARPPRLGLRLKSTFRSGDLVLRAKNLTIGYPGNLLFRSDDITLRRGEVAALIGKNGTGKTTLLKTLLGEHKPLSGQMTLGAGLKVGYFAQVHEALNLDNTVLDELLRHKYMLLSEARNYLGSYLFRADDVYKKVSMLSGGERGRLALAILALQGANFLLLDEPTNHLDIGAQEVLQEVLEHFEGTILLVSHDRYLIDRLASQIWTLDQGEMRVFEGGYQEYIEKVEQERLSSKEQRMLEKKQGMPVPTKIAVAVKQSTPKGNQALKKLEAQIHSLETDLREIERIMEKASAAQKYDDLRKLHTQYESSQAQLESLMAQWVEMAG